jgi:pimeloyl-ACP methyl ester carboxylesterase
MLTRRSGWGDFRVAVVSSGGEAWDVLFVHANGFCKELWAPIAREIGARNDDFAWASIDQRGHGDSERGTPPYGWDAVARDVLAVAGDRRGMVGVGHSSGGAAIARAEVLQPGTFRAMVLIEPIIFPPPHGRYDIPLAQTAERRRAVFADRQAAHDRFSMGPFRDWEPEVLDLYVDHAFRDTGVGWELKCAPEIEADFFREGSNHDTWEHLDEIVAPVVLVAGERSDSHHGPYLSQLRARFQNAQLIVVSGAGHLVPMEQPKTIASIVNETVDAHPRRP